MMSFFFYSFSTAPLLSLLFLFLSSSVRFFFVCTNDLPRNDETTKWFAFFYFVFRFFATGGTRMDTVARIAKFEDFLKIQKSDVF